MEIVEQIGFALALVAVCAVAYRLMMRAERDGRCGDGGACSCDAPEAEKPLVRITRKIARKEQGG